MTSRLCKIVLTGAPGAGKTTVLQTLVHEPAWQTWRDRIGGVVGVEESATSVYGRRGVRWDQIDDANRRDVQREIYRDQLAKEEALQDKQARVALLDRGTIDGSAYWPDGPAAYWRAVDSDPNKELDRYDLVVLLESSAAIGRYDGDATNAVRFETAQAAIANGELLAKLWGDHPRRVKVPASDDFLEKVERVAAVIASEVAN
jgi:predicted ATPase